MLGLIWPCNSLATSVHPSLFSALVDLNGRFFAGREVRASFFDFDKYLRGDIQSMWGCEELHPVWWP